VEEDLTASGLLNSRWGQTIVTESAADAALVGRSIRDIAAEWKRSPFDALCAIAVADEMRTRVRTTFANDDVDGVSRLLQGDGCILGLSDAGAHVSQLCDAVMPTDFLAHWVRDRGVVSLERGVRKLTGEIAHLLEVDRGLLQVGAPADVVVIDYERLSPGPIRRVCDFPADGERLVADQPAGIDHVLVNGVPIRLNGVSLAGGLEPKPGRILRSRREGGPG
jgi:N-acyl-D-aspartate/D-glutamate deacylase